MKMLYTVDYWDPESEGGIINVIAENDAECIEILSILSDEEEFPEDCAHLIPQNVITANKLNLADDYESGIIDAFIF